MKIFGIHVTTQFGEGGIEGLIFAAVDIIFGELVDEMEQLLFE